MHFSYCIHLDFTYDDIPIQGVQPLVTDAASLHGTNSSRLLLSGRFSETIKENRRLCTKEYSCVIKCAGTGATSDDDGDGVQAIYKEFSIYTLLEELLEKKIGVATTTGCVNCYHMHPSAHYLVLEAYGQDIRSLLVPDFSLIPQLTEAIITAVAALHSFGIMHGDLKPHNILFGFDRTHRYIVKLCDLDCAHKVGEVCAAAVLNTNQYESPEVYFASRAGATVTAALSMDMFSLGIVLWQVLSSSPYPPVSIGHLPESYSNQNKFYTFLALPEKWELYTTFIYSITDRISANSLYMRARDVAASKAVPNYYKEKQDNRFLREEVSEKIDGLGDQLYFLRQGQELLGVQVGRVLQDNKRLDTMMRTLIAGTHTIPTYAIILPVTAKSWLSKANPLRLVRHQYRLYFLCSYTRQIALCGPRGEGYTITVTKQWVRDAAPVLMAGLIVLKLALMAGGIPLPIPDLSPLLDTPALHVKFLDAALHLVKNPCDDAKGNTELILDRAISAVGSVAVEEVLEMRNSKGMSLEEGSLKAYATIQGILKSDNIDIALSSGLRQVIHPKSGKTAWVLDSDTIAQQFCSSANHTV